MLICLFSKSISYSVYNDFLDKRQVTINTNLSTDLELLCLELKPLLTFIIDLENLRCRANVGIELTH